MKFTFHDSLDINGDKLLSNKSIFSPNDGYFEQLEPITGVS